jgi:hypothetical protein
LNRAFVISSNTTAAEDRLAKFGIHLPDVPMPFGACVPTVQATPLF